MIRKTFPLLVYVLFSIAILTACAKPTEDSTQLPTPTVTRALPTKTQPSPTLTPVPPTLTTVPPTPTTKPKSTPTRTETPVQEDKVVSCPGAPDILLKLKDWAMVSLDPPISNNVRSAPGLQGERIGKLKPGEIVRIMDGPQCADGYAWWSMQNLAGLKGWTAEGDAKAYWLLHPLDAFFYDTASQSSTSKVVLNGDKKYQIVMSGTFSIWGPEQWTAQGVCIVGKSELLPMYPSPLRLNGQVGVNPFYLFARPFYGDCENRTLDSSQTTTAMMFSLDGGKNYSNPIPLIAKYREDHTYIYEITGQGYPLKVKLDDPVLDDNYGVILILIEETK
jgi:hypothetical protein